MDFQKLITRYKQFGGAKLVWQYVKLGAVPTVLKGLWRFTVKGSWFKVGVFQCFKGLYGEIIRKVEPFLVQKYSSKVQEFKKFLDGPSGKAERNSSRELKHEHPKVIWWCWLQGYDAAPPIVKACYNSLMREFKSSSVQEVQGLSDGYEIKVIDAENWKEYVELPDYIVKKWEKKQIPPALYSDLLRLELLIKYGGTWIDSTVLCTGFKEFESLSSSSGSTSSPSVQEFKKYLEADLFLFQYTQQGSIPVSISNWFISACSNNEVLIVLRDMLYAYWKDYDCVLDYYIFHLFFAMISKEYPEQITAMHHGQSQNSLMLLHHLNETFSQNKWDKLRGRVRFHKLAFRLNDDIKNNKENYFNHILSTYYFNQVDR